MCVCVCVCVCVYIECGLQFSSNGEVSLEEKSKFLFCHHLKCNQPNTHECVCVCVCVC